MNIVFKTKWKISFNFFEITGNKGLISVDRNTRLLYHLQYPVPIKSSTKDFKASKIWNYYSARLPIRGLSRPRTGAAPGSMIRDHCWSILTRLNLLATTVASLAWILA